jgi:hypothetical protein
LNAYRESRHTIRARLSTTHPAMASLFKACFGSYGHCSRVPDKAYLPGHYCWKLSVNLDETFNFIIDKPSKIPVSSGMFYHFLAGYADSEGCWCIYSDKGRSAVAFIIESKDTLILKGLQSELFRSDLHPLYYRDKSDNAKSRIELRRKDEAISLAEKLIRLSKHSEKVMKMALVAESQTSDWFTLNRKIRNLKSAIHRDVIDYKNEAERYYKIGIVSRGA